MSAIGTKRTSPSAPHMSAFGGRADMAIALRMSAFDPKQTSETSLNALEAAELELLDCARWCLMIMPPSVRQRE